MEYKVHELSVDKFEDYGFYVCEKDNTPLAENARFTYWDQLAKFNLGPMVSAGIVKGHKSDDNVLSIERHKKTPEILVGLEGDALVLLAKPDNTSSEIEGLKAFKIKEGDTVVLHPGTWHSPPSPAAASCRLLVLFNQGTPAEDIEEINLDNAYLKYNK